MKTNSLLLTLFITLLTLTIKAQYWQDVGISTGVGKVVHADANNNIYTACDLTDRNTYGIAKWDGSAWVELGSDSTALNANNEIKSIITDASGNVYAAGNFKNSSEKCYVAKWDGSSWNELGTLNANGGIYSLAIDASGNIYAGGWFRDLAITDNAYVAKWDGNNWSALGTGINAPDGYNSAIYSIITDASGNIYATGSFKNSFGQNYVAKWDGSNWNELGALQAKFNTGIYSLAIDGIGNIYAAAGTGSFKYVSKWNGSSWNELGSGSNALGAKRNIYSIATDAVGNVYVAASFFNGSGNRIAKWNGSTWTKLGDELYGETINSIATDALGNIYAAGEAEDKSGWFQGDLKPYTSAKAYIAKWNGNNWDDLDTINNSLNTNNRITSIITDAAGNVYATGHLNSAEYAYVAKWNGTNWSELGSGSNALNANGRIETIAIDAAGNIYAGGVFENSSGDLYVAKWDGISWTELGTTSELINLSPHTYSITSLVADPSGNIYAAGDFANSMGEAFVAKWDGTSWSELGNSSELNPNIYISNITTDLFGNVYAAGSFGDGYNLAKWNGTNWSLLGNGGNELNADGNIYTIATDVLGNVFVSGDFTDFPEPEYIAKWDGSSWSKLGGNVFNVHGIYSITTDNAGNVYVGGSFPYVAKWDGNNWSKLGGEYNTLNANNSISSLTTDVYGNIYAGGNFMDFNEKAYVSKFSVGAISVPCNNLQVSLTTTTEMMCIGNTVDLQTTSNDNSSNLIYAWYKNEVLLNDNQNTFSDTPTETTTYKVIVSNTQGCIDTTETTVTVIPLPTVLLNSTEEHISENGSVELFASGGIVYEWQPAESLSAPDVMNPIASPLQTTEYTVTVTNSNNCTQTATVTVVVDEVEPTDVVFSSASNNHILDSLSHTTEITTGIYNEINANNTINIYPNPASEELTIQGINETTQALIYSLEGKLLQSEQISNDNSVINISSLSKGVYFITLQSGNEVVTKRLVKN